MTPTHATIAIEEVVNRAKAQLRINDTTEYDLFLEMLCREGLASLNALSQLIKQECCLSVEGQSAKLPANFVRYLALKVDVEADTDSNDPINDQIFNGCQMFLYADTKFLNNCGCDTAGWQEGGFQIRNGYIHFNNDQTIIEATLAYLALNVDANGKPVVYEKYERALSSYICYMYALSYADKYHQYAIAEYKNTWQAQRSLIIGRDVAQSFQDDKREIQKIWNATLVSPLLNYNI